MSRPDPARLIDILESAALISDLVNQTPSIDDFVNDESIHSGVLHHLTIVGEATANISPPLRSKYPEVNWKRVVAFRNRIIHEYFGTDLDVIWQTVHEALPEYVGNILKIFKTEFPDLIEYLPKKD